MTLPLHASRPVEQRRGSMALVVKRSTSEVHRRAEAAVLATALFDSRPRYEAYLARLRGFYVAIEPRLEAQLGSPLGPRAKAPLLARDLRDLGWSDASLAALPACHDVPRISSPAAAYGVAYVLEGKTLGARFLLAEAQLRLGLDAGRGATFLAGYGPQTGSMWTSFRAEMEAFVATHGRRRTLLHAAHATFAAFVRWVSAPSLPAARPRH